MAYIGSSAAPLPVAFATAQAEPFSGNGSTTAFTLSRSVLRASDIEVLVNNVRQSPYDGSYSVSNTTLTFSEAPSSGSSNIYVVYRDQPLGSIVPTKGSVGKLQLDIVNVDGTGAAVMPSGTTAQRPAAPASGMYRMNSTTGNPEWYDAISSSWVNFADPLSYSIETLVIAGGGAGGSGYYGGGGGAGGYLYGSNSTVSMGTAFTVTVGAGGSGSTSLSVAGGSGSNSSIGGTIAQTAIGGGGAGSRNQTSGQTGASGGSGGGAAWPGTTGGAGTSGQGYAGGNTGSGYGSGGGGAGGVGGAAFDDAYLGSYGGPGSNAHSTWATATSSGASGGYFAGGGGAGTRSGAPTNHYYGGAGGGGNGGVQGGAAPVAGAVNTGSGGGGADFGDSYTGDTHNRGASGGSGIVIIRYAGAQRASGGTVTSSGGYTYHKFTTSGTFTA